MPEISVIVPVYRAEAYLRDCLDSILSQTFSEFEVILVDDGSPDRSGAICEEYARRDARVRVMHQSNQGQAAARNHAMETAKGNWLCFVDSDDQIHPQMLELLYRAAMQSGAGISLCRMLEQTELPEGFSAPRQLTYDTRSMDEPTLLRLYDRGEYPGWEACAKLIRRELAMAYPFQSGRVYEDNEAVAHWLLPAGTIARIPEQLYFYRTNPDSTTKSQFSLKKLDSLWALESIIRYYRCVGYLVLADRFLALYTNAVINSCSGIRMQLNRSDLVGQTVARVWHFTHRAGLRLTKAQWISILDGAYPEAMKRFWTAAEGVRKIIKPSKEGRK